MRVFLKVLGFLAAFVLILLIIAQIILSPRVCTRIINKYYPEFIDGKLEMTDARVSLFSHFPAISATVNNLVITYPSEADRMDTLASFKRFDAAINVFSLIDGKVNLKRVELIRPRAFIHFDGTGHSNLEVLKFLRNDGDSVRDEDTTALVMPDIVVRRLLIGERAFFLCQSDADSLKAMLYLKELSLKGRLMLRRPYESAFKLNLDTLFVGGKYKKDTLMFDLNHLGAVTDGRGKAGLDIKATAYAASHVVGRMKLPLALNTEIESRYNDAGGFDIHTNSLGFDVATIHVNGNLDLSTTGEGDMGVDGFVDIDHLDFQKLIDDYASHFIKGLDKIRTDAVMSAHLCANGNFNSAKGDIPAFSLELTLPDCYVRHTDFDLVPHLSLSAIASSGQNSPVSVNLKSFYLKGPGFSTSLEAASDDILSSDPPISASFHISSSLDSLGTYLADALQMKMKGRIGGDASGKFRLSDFRVGNACKADVKSDFLARGIRLTSYDDSLNVYLDSLRLRAGVMESRFARKSGKKNIPRSFAAAVNIDSLFMSYTGNMVASGKNLSVFAQTASSPSRAADGSRYFPLMAMLKFGSARLTGADSVSLRLGNSTSTLRIGPEAGDRTKPSLKISSDNKFLSARSGVHRAFINGLNLNAKAVMNPNTGKRRTRQFLDSLYRVHPDWTRDSLKNHYSAQRRAGKVPDWLSEKDFQSSDLHFDFGEAFRKYFTQWNVSGGMGMKRLGVRTPAFPLRTSITDFQGSFTNDYVSLDTLRLVSGASDVQMRGKISNLRRVLTGKGIMRVDALVKTDSLNVFELLNAYTAGQENLKKDLSAYAALDDEELEKVSEGKEVQNDSTVSSLIVIPANVDANLAVRGRELKISGLDIHNFSADLKMKERCLQLTGMKAVSDIGGIGLDAFYSTKTKQQLYAGFDLSFNDIEVGDVIELIPQVDTLMPLLKSFAGQVNCNITATSGIDTNMNVVMPSIDGIMRITGKDLHFSDNKQVATLGRILMFKNPTRATVDSLRVEGVLKNSTLEVFPFILNMDRWVIALAGIQNLDNSFKYNLSLVKAPLLFRFGVDIYGNNFDDMNVKFGKSKFRDANVPSFSTVIDTTRVNLRSSILDIFRKGVEKTLSEQRSSRSIEEFRKHSGYLHSAALDTLETLSPALRKQIDYLKTDYDEGK